MVLVSGDVNTTYWWMAYYARHNNCVWAIAHQTDDIYFGERDYDRTDLYKIPPGAEIFYAPDMYRLVEPAEYQLSIAALLEFDIAGAEREHRSVGGKKTTAPGDGLLAKNFDIAIYSRAEFHAELVISMALSESNEVRINGQVFAGDNEVILPLRIHQGGQTIDISSDGLLEIKECRIIIKG